MAFEIINGRNNGYPCIPELNERQSAALVSPVCEYMFKAGATGYPVVAGLSENTCGISVPYPETLMICFGKDVNDGYPWIRNIKALRSVTESSLFFEGRRAERLYFNGNICETAFCNGKKVFDTFISREKIV